MADRRSGPGHLIDMPGCPSWRLWRPIVLRAPGFPVDGLARLAVPSLAVAADAVVRAEAVGGSPAVRAAALEAYGETFRENAVVLSRRIGEIAGDGRFREAVAWQNNAFLHRGLASLLRAEPAGTGRHGKRRRGNEQTVASYWQRYCAKNDTIGFFGPVVWARWDDTVEFVTVMPGKDLLAERTVYLEGWAVDALAATLERDPDVRQWLAPRRIPAQQLDGLLLRRPHAPPVELSPAQAVVLRSSDGTQTVPELAHRLSASMPDRFPTPADVQRILAGLAARGFVRIGFDLPIKDPMRHLERMLDRIGDERVRARARATIGDIEAARIQLAAAGGSAERVDHAFGVLNEAFTRVTGAQPTRLHGRTYAGRTLAYEDCRRDLDLAVGRRVLDRLAGPLGLLLDSARWLTHQCAAAYRRAFSDLYDELADRCGTEVIPLGQLTFRSHELLFGQGRRPVDDVAALFQKQWSAILDVPGDARRVELSVAALRPLVDAVFDAPCPGWAAARYHNPDLMIAAAGADALRRGEFQLVIGELHVGLNTAAASQCMVERHPDPETLRRMVNADVATPPVIPVFPKAWPDVGSRSYPPPALIAADSYLLALGPDRPPAPGHRVLPLAGLVVERVDGQLVVRGQTGEPSFDICEVFGEFLSIAVVNRFALLPPRPHTPRITIDDVVVARERWVFDPSELGFPAEKDRAARFLAARRWARAHDLPDLLFVRADPAEPKPILLDLRSPVLVDLVAAAVRRAARADESATITVTEMLPTPDLVWLPDAAGRLYTSELRLIAVDQAGRS